MLRCKVTAATTAATTAAIDVAAPPAAAVVVHTANTSAYNRPIERTKQINRERERANGKKRRKEKEKKSVTHHKFIDFFFSYAAARKSSEAFIKSEKWKNCTYLRSLKVLNTFQIQPEKIINLIFFSKDQRNPFSHRGNEGRIRKKFCTEIKVMFKIRTIQHWPRKYYYSIVPMNCSMNLIHLQLLTFREKPISFFVNPITFCRHFNLSSLFASLQTIRREREK